MYVRTSMQCNILSDLWDEAYEVLWLGIETRRLPRIFSNIIVGAVYHPPPPPPPPNADYMDMKDYILPSLESVGRKFPNQCAIILP